MIVLDTNVLSALMLSEPDVAVTRWLDLLAPESVWTTAVTVFELRVGIERLPASRKRKHLEESYERVLSEDLENRVLEFDSVAAQAAATLTVKPRRRGRLIEIRDTLIAGIVISRRAELATGNSRHFEDLGCPIINPWNLGRT